MGREWGLKKLGERNTRIVSGKHILGRNKSNLDFVQRGQLHCEILGEGKNTKKGR